MKDGNIFRGLSALIKARYIRCGCERITDDILKRIGSKNPAYEWSPSSCMVSSPRRPAGPASTCLRCWRWRSQRWTTRGNSRP